LIQHCKNLHIIDSKSITLFCTLPEYYFSFNSNNDFLADQSVDYYPHFEYLARNSCLTFMSCHASVCKELLFIMWPNDGRKGRWGFSWPQCVCVTLLGMGLGRKCTFSRRTRRFAQCLINYQLMCYKPQRHSFHTPRCTSAITQWDDWIGWDWFGFDWIGMCRIGWRLDGWGGSSLISIIIIIIRHTACKAVIALIIIDFLLSLTWLSVWVSHFQLAGLYILLVRLCERPALSPSANRQISGLAHKYLGQAMAMATLAQSKHGRPSKAHYRDKQWG